MTSTLGSASHDDSLTIPALDGFPLGATLFRAGTAAAPLVIIAAATAVKRAYYAAFAEFLRSRGFHALTFDYRGVGDSRPKTLTGFHAEMHQWGELDLAGVIKWVTDEIKPQRTLLVGHSIAGQIFPLANNNHLVNAAYFVASQTGYLKLWKGKEFFLAATLWHLAIPFTTSVFGYFPGRVLGNAEDLPSGVVREWARWSLHPDYILSHGSDVREKFARVRIPLKFLSFTDDRLMAPRPAVEIIRSWYGSESKEHRRIDPKEIGVRGIGHFGFFKAHFTATLWQEALVWLQRHAVE
jgi:predicted alpha/beta hydrolase